MQRLQIDSCSYLIGNEGTLYFRKEINRTNNTNEIMRFRKYVSYSIEEFVEDDSFREWVKYPNDQNVYFWNQFLRRYPEQKDTVLQARALLLEMNHYFGQSSKNASDIRINLQKVLESKENIKPKTISTQHVFGKRARTWAVAATLLLLVGLFSWVLINADFGKQHYFTGYGEWKTVVLPDGSQVKLNANSTLTIRKKWVHGDDRQVWLDGEAFFEVKKQTDSKAKFRVITEDLVVQVLGTSFNVNRRDQQTEVFLEEGSIKLELQGHSEKLLKPGDFIAFSGETKAIIEQRNKVESVTHTSWKDGVLILKDKLGSEIFEKIEEIYGVKIQVENEEILKQVKAISVPMDKLEIAIPILEGNFNVKIIKNDNLLIIK